MVDQLIIIGNGFDMNCSLKSGYTDWYKSRFGGGGYFRRLLNQLDQHYVGRSTDSRPAIFYESIEIVDIAARGFVAPKSLLKVTAWDFLILRAKKSSGTWKSVEEFIETTLQNQDVLKFHDDDWLSLEKYVYQVNHYPEVKSDVAADASIDPILRLLALRYPQYMLSADYPNNDYIKMSLEPQDLKESLFKVLLDELKIFEKEFSQYLKSQTIKNKSYRNEALNLLSRIAGGDNIANDSIAILSFNYTNPFSEECKLFNVHGTLEDDNIIFGIDKQDTDEEEHARFDKVKKILPFTKTYRKLFNPQTAVLANCRDVKTVKFYGHSLGRMDYSYFLSIFDSFSVYDGELSLSFYYSIYDKEKRINIMNDRFSEVVNLIDKYGSTFPNISQGKNLMHRLMLEGRLNIIDVGG